MPENNTFLTITDYTGSLFAGSHVVCYANKFNMSGKNILGTKPFTMKDTAMITDDNSNLGSNYDRRKGYISYQGFNNPVLRISGNWTGSSNDGLGAGSEMVNPTSGVELGSPILTPYKIIKFAISNGGPYYLNEKRLTQTMIGVQGTGSALYSASGIPVIVDDWQIDFDMNSENNIKWSMSFTEDKQYNINN